MKKLIALLVFAFCGVVLSQPLLKENNFQKFKPKIKNGKYILEKQAKTESLLTGVLIQIWIPDNWEDSERIVYSYNASGFYTEIKYEEFVDNNWITNMRMQFEYNGDEVSTDYFYVYEDGVLNYAVKHTYQSSNGKITEIISYDWDEATSDWVTYQKEVFEYSGELNTRIAIYEWSEFSSEWETSGETIYTYDNQKREIEMLDKIWSSQDNQFQNSNITTTEYHSNGELSRQLSKSWDVTTQQWSDSNYTLYEWEYDANANCTVYTSSMVISLMGFTFVTKTKDEYEYDSNNYLIKETYYVWDDFGKLWTPVLKQEYSIDAEGQVKEVIAYGLAFDEWVKEEKHIYNYDGAVNVEDELVLLEEFALFQNYPNPFNPSTTISYSIGKAGHVEIYVYDILGNMITDLVNEYQSAGNYNIKFNAQNLSSGIYFYKLKTENFEMSKKCLLLK